jgi:hypothetical protein
VVNLAPGVIAVEMRCTRGHAIPVLTGHAIGERAWTRRSWIIGVALVLTAFAPVAPRGPA